MVECCKTHVRLLWHWGWCDWKFGRWKDGVTIILQRNPHCAQGWPGVRKSWFFAIDAKEISIICDYHRDLFGKVKSPKSNSIPWSWIVESSFFLAKAVFSCELNPTLLGLIPAPPAHLCEQGPRPTHWIFQPVVLILVDHLPKFSSLQTCSHRISLPKR